MIEDGFTIHVYCFQEKEEKKSLLESSIRERIFKYIKEMVIFVRNIDIHHLKDVSKNKAMMCISITIKSDEKCNITSVKKLKVN